MWVCRSNIPPTCVFWKPDDSHGSRSAQWWQITSARRYASQQPTGKRNHIVPRRMQVSVSTLWHAAANYCTQRQVVTSTVTGTRYEVLHRSNTRHTTCPPNGMQRNWKTCEARTCCSERERARASRLLPVMSEEVGCGDPTTQGGRPRAGIHPSARSWMVELPA